MIQVEKSLTPHHHLSPLHLRDNTCVQGTVIPLDLAQRFSCNDQKFQITRAQNVVTGCSLWVVSYGKQFHNAS